MYHLLLNFVLNLFKHGALLLEGKQLRKQGQTHPTNLFQVVGTVLILLDVISEGGLLQCHSGK